MFLIENKSHLLPHHWETHINVSVYFHPYFLFLDQNAPDLCSSP